jgi:hypothetical protein
MFFRSIIPSVWTSFSKTISVPGRRQTATCRLSGLAKPRVPVEKFVETKVSATSAGGRRSRNRERVVPQGRRLRRTLRQRNDRRSGIPKGARHVRAAGACRPSARYIDDVGYVGGFSEKQIEELLEFLEDNHMGWSAAMAPTIMGNPEAGTRRGTHQ